MTDTKGNAHYKPTDFLSSEEHKKKEFSRMFKLLFYI